MKPILRILALLLGVLALILLPLLLTGCAAARNALYRPITSELHVPEQVVTNYVTTRTNTVIVPAVVDAAGNVLTSAQTINQVETLPVPVPVLTTNPAAVLVVTNGWEKRPEVFETAEVVGGAIPGWGTLVAGLFGAAGTLGAAWLNRKHKGTEAALVGTIQGIEQIRRALQRTDEGRRIDEQLVAALERAQRDHNAVDIVQRLIELHTGYTREQVDLGRILHPQAATGTHPPDTSGSHTLDGKA
jgi:hypothetical protein